MRQIHEDALFVQRTHELATAIGESDVLLRGERRARRAEARAREVYERDAQHETVRNATERVGRMIERIAALHADEGSVLAGRARRPVLAVVSNDGELFAHRVEERSQLLEVLDERLEPRARATERVRRDDPGRPRELGLEDARKIHLAVHTRAEQAASVALPEIVAEDAMPDERVDVKIDHLAREIELHGLPRNAELACPTRGIRAVIAMSELDHAPR